MKLVKGLGTESRKKLSEILRQTKGTITPRQAADVLGITRVRASQLLSYWAGGGWLSRVRRGMYTPLAIESRGSETPIEDPWIVAESLFKPCYIGGWSAAEHWGLTEQIFKSVLVMTTKKQRNKNPVLKGTPFVLRTISSDSMFGLKAVWRGQVKVNISDPARTMVDMLANPTLGGGIRPVSDLLRAYLKSVGQEDMQLIDYAQRLKNGAVFKRLGYLLECFAPERKNLIDTCRQRLSTGNAKLDIQLPAERLVTRWRLWIPENWVKRDFSD